MLSGPAARRRHLEGLVGGQEAGLAVVAAGCVQHGADPAGSEAAAAPGAEWVTAAAAEFRLPPAWQARPSRSPRRSGPRFRGFDAEGLGSSCWMHARWVGDCFVGVHRGTQPGQVLRASRLTTGMTIISGISYGCSVLSRISKSRVAGRRGLDDQQLLGSPRRSGPATRRRRSPPERGSRRPPGVPGPQSGPAPAPPTPPGRCTAPGWREGRRKLASSSRIPSGASAAKKSLSVRLVF